MKKLMIAAMAVAAGAAFADTAPITSANVVGFEGFDPGEDALSIIGIQFNEVGSNEGVKWGALVGEFEEGDNIQLTSTDEESGDIMISDYYYFPESSGMGGEGWFGDDGLVNDEYIPCGKAAWFAPQSPKTITTAGEVKKGHFIHTTTEPLSLVSSAYPTPFCPNSEYVAWPTAQEGDNIQVAYQDEETGDVMIRDYYYFPESSGMGGEGWFGDDGLVPANEAIARGGEGFWWAPCDPETACFSEVSPLGDIEK